MIYQPPDKSGFIEHFDNSLKESCISYIKEFYLMGDFNINMWSGDTMLLDKQYYDSYSQAPHLVKKYIDLCFSHSLHQLITEPTRTTKHTKSRIDHIFMCSPEKVIQIGVNEMGLTDHELIYCSRKTPLLKLNEHYEISIS